MVVAAAAGLLAGSSVRAATRAGDEAGRRSRGTILGAVSLGALLAAAAHGLLITPVAAGAYDLLVRSPAAGGAAPRLLSDAGMALVLAGPSLLALGTIWGLGGRSGRIRWIGMSLAGAGLAALAGAGTPEEARAGAPLLASILLVLASPLAALAIGSSGARSAAPVAGVLARPSFASGRPAILAAAVLLGSAASPLLLGGSGRLFRLVLGTGRPGAVLAGVGWICAGTGCLAAWGLLRRRTSAWRLLGFSLGLAGTAGLFAASTGGYLPRTYLWMLGRVGATAPGESVILPLLAVAGVGLPAFFLGAAGAALAAGAGAITLGLAAAGAAAGIACLHLAAVFLGTWGTMVLGGAILGVVGGVFVLLEAGSIWGRALWSLALLVMSALMLSDAGSWDRRPVVAAPAQTPSAYLAARGGGPRRFSRDRVLEYREGRATTSARRLVDGWLEALVINGREEATGSFEGRRGHELAVHLPALLGPEKGAALSLTPLTAPALDAFDRHAAFEVRIAARDTAAAGTALDAGLEQPLAMARALPSGGVSFLLGSPRRALAASGPLALITAAPLVDDAEIAEIASPRTLDLIAARLAPEGIVCLPLSLRAIAREGLEEIFVRFRARFDHSSLWVAGTYAYLLGGEGAWPARLARIRARLSRPGVAGALAQYGLDDPLKILALQAIDLGKWTGRSVSPGALAAPLAEARFEPHLAENLEWLSDLIARAEGAVAYPHAFEPGAVEAARRRVGALRGVQGSALKARALLHRSEPAAALDTARNALARDPADLELLRIEARAHARLAEAAIAAGKMPEARAHYASALEADPGDIESLTGLAWLRHAQGDRERAEELLARGVRIAPWVAILHYRLGLVLLEEGKLPEARMSLLTAFDRDPRQSEPLVLLGDIARMEGDRGQALELYAAALSLGGRVAEARAAMATARLEMGEVGAAAEEIERALRDKPGDPEALLTRAKIRVAQHDHEGARQDLLAAVTTGGPPYRARAMLEPALRELILDEARPDSKR